MSKLEGRCLCGAVTYTAQGEPLWTALCHCGNCQRQGGGAFSITVGVEEAALRVGGELREYVKDPAGARRRFCPTCGTPVYNSSPSFPGVAIVMAGTLDDRSWLNPLMEVWGDSAQPWVAEVEGRPRLPRSFAEAQAG